MMKKKKVASGATALGERAGESTGSSSNNNTSSKNSQQQQQLQQPQQLATSKDSKALLQAFVNDLSFWNSNKGSNSSSNNIAGSSHSTSSSRRGTQESVKGPVHHSVANRTNGSVGSSQTSHERIESSRTTNKPPKRGSKQGNGKEEIPVGGGVAQFPQTATRNINNNNNSSDDGNGKWNPAEASALSTSLAATSQGQQQSVQHRNPYADGLRQQGTVVSTGTGSATMQAQGRFRAPGDDNNATATATTTTAQEEEQRLVRAAAVWRTAVDPASGRVYYYDTVTQMTQWEKPAPVRALEKKRKKEQRQRDIIFFREMEQNILASLARCELIPTVPLTKTVKQGPPKEPLPAPLASIKVRTISNMNEHLLSQIHKDTLSDTMSSKNNNNDGGSHHKKNHDSQYGTTLSRVAPLPRPSPHSSETDSVNTTATTDSNNATTATSNQSALSGSGLPPMPGRPPLPDRTWNLSPSHLSEMADNLEFSPDASRSEFSNSALEAELLRGEHLLDSYLLENGGHGADGTSPSPPSFTSSLSSGLALASSLSNTIEGVTTHPNNNNSNSTTLNASSTHTTTSSANNAAAGHMRRNTGGTMYVESTMDAPDIDKTIKCVCGVYRAHIVQASQRESQRSPVSVQAALVNLKVFLDDVDSDVSSSNNNKGNSSAYGYSNGYYSNHRSSAQTKTSSVTTKGVPTMEEIERFYQEFYQRSQMAHDTIIMSLIYVERLIKETNGALTPALDNWASVLFSCMILASKVWDDLSMWNIDFSNVSAASGLSQFTLQRINQLELAVLTCLNFNVKVSASEYAKYYFLIRTMLIRSGELGKAAQPLRKDDAKLLEHKTSHYQESKLKRNNTNCNAASTSRRATSVDWSSLNGPRSSFSSNGSIMVGPVLNDTVCLEQIVAMKRS